MPFDKEKISKYEYSCSRMFIFDEFFYSDNKAETFISFFSNSFENKGNLTIPESVKEIGDYAFFHCEELTGKLIIPKSVEKIGKYAFCGCMGLTGPLVIPNSVKEIGEKAFSLCNGLIGPLNISESLKIIQNGTFEYCSGFNGSLEIPSSVIEIRSSAFDGCSGLTGSLIFPNSVTKIGSYAFYGCSGLTGSLIFSNSVIEIGSYAFYGCSGLTGILTIPNFLTTIGSHAFYECSGLTGFLNIPNSITKIGSYAFYKCSGLEGSLIIPKSVTKIGSYAFYKCSGFTGFLEIPKSVTKIGSSAFYKCSGLIGSLTIPESVIKIGSFAFYKCSGLTGSLTIPKNVTEIGSYAFYECSGLTGSLKIPNKLTEIRNFTFYKCSGLTGSLIIPKFITRIGSYAFYECSGLTGPLIMPNSLKEIGSFAFQNCLKMTGELIIPECIKTIGKNAFDSTNFSTIIYKGRSEPKCNESIGLPEKKIVLVENHYLKNTFCLHQTKYINVDENRPDSTTKKEDLLDSIAKEDPKSSKENHFQIKTRKNTNSNQKILSIEIDLSFIKNYLFQEKSIYITMIFITVTTIFIQYHFYRLKIKELSFCKKYIENLQISQNTKEIEKNAKFKFDLMMHDYNVFDVDTIKQMDRKTEIGEGTQSNVYEIMKTNRFALKVLKVNKDEEIKKLHDKVTSLMKEYEFLNTLSHPNIIKAYGICYGDESEPPSILLEICSSNLYKEITKLTDFDKITMIYEISDGMMNVHKAGLIHRDLKPQNILLDKNKHVKISDFGISILVDVKTQTTYDIKGTLKFMAPELLNEQKYDQKVDVYSFGVLLFFILTGGDYPNISLVDVGNGKTADIPEEINEISRYLINLCWKTEPYKRPTFEYITYYIKSNNFNLINRIDRQLPQIKEFLNII